VKRRKVSDNATPPLNVMIAGAADLHSAHIADDDTDDDLCSEMTDASQVTSPSSLFNLVHYNTP